MNKQAIALLSLGHFSIDFCQGVVPALVPFLVVDRHFSYTAAAGLVFAISATSSVVQPLFGQLADRLALPWLLPASVFLAGAALSLGAQSADYGVVLTAFGLSGLGVAAFHPEAARKAYSGRTRRLAGVRHPERGDDLPVDRLLRSEHLPGTSLHQPLAPDRRTRKQRARRFFGNEHCRHPSGGLAGRPRRPADGDPYGVRRGGGVPGVVSANDRPELGAGGSGPAGCIHLHANQCAGRAGTGISAAPGRSRLGGDSGFGGECRRHVRTPSGPPGGLARFKFRSRSAPGRTGGRHGPGYRTAACRPR
jgi:hypothetical protein